MSFNYEDALRLKAMEMAQECCTDDNSPNEYCTRMTLDLFHRSDMDADIDGLVANTGISARDKLLGQSGILKGGQIFVSDNIFTSAGATTSALLVETNPMNFVLGVGQEVSVYNF